MKATLLRGPRSGCLVGMFCSFCSNRWLLNNCGLLNRNILYCWSNSLNSFLRTVFCTAFYTAFYSVSCIALCITLCIAFGTAFGTACLNCFFLISLISLLHFTKSEIYYVLTKMSSGKFLINIHFADIYHFLLISIITQNAQSNYYYLKCFHHTQYIIFLFLSQTKFP